MDVNGNGNHFMALGIRSYFCTCICQSRYIRDRVTAILFWRTLQKNWRPKFCGIW